MRRKRSVAVAVALAAVAFLAVHGSLERPVRWTPDGLFYQARVLELRGETHEAAFQEAFEGPIAERLRRVDAEHSGNPAWVAYNERFFERRVGVSVAGAAIYPAAGERSLLYVSLAGYLIAVVAVFWLLLLRFSLPVASAVALVTALLPALSDNAPLPHTDTWGLALLSVALATAVVTVDRGLRWLPLWAGALLLLAFTRDSTWVAILAVAWCAWRWRSRRAFWLAVTGVAAVLPALLLFPLPLRELLAFAVSDFRPAPELSWFEIAERYPGTLADTLHSNAGFVRGGEWYTGAYFALGLGLLFVLAGRRPVERSVALVRAAAVVAVPYLLTVPLFSGFRLELVLVPGAAFGFALGLERAEALVRARWAARRAEALTPALATRQAVRSS
jgi:MFS family permease